MSVDLHYDREKGILYAKPTGSATQDDLRAILEKITTSSDYPPDVPTLWDVREADFARVDRGMLARVIDTRKRHPERGRAKLAAVVADDLGFGMSRMYELLSVSQSLPQRIRVFRNLAEAEAWLLEPD